jgi:ubiquinone/menaquinone biosynthesis C-methylase UbiE
MKDSVVSLSTDERVKEFYDTSGANWGDNYELDAEGHSTNPAVLRARLVHKIIDRYGCDNIFDAGGADAPFLVQLLKMGKRASGCDFSSVLVARGRERLKRAGFDENLLWEGDVTNLARVPDGAFDTVVCLGVLPHVSRMGQAVAELARIAKPGALLILSFRNDLFDLFTFNRFTLDFFNENFIARLPCDDVSKARAREALRGLVANPDVPEPGYTPWADKSFGKITRINSNPITLPEAMAPFGLRHELTGYYKFHPLPPLARAALSDYAEIGARMDAEFCFHWIGMFMCSTFVSTYRKTVA